MSLRALLFDFDGTLAETERDGHRVAYNRAFADLGLPWDWSVRHYGELLAIAGGKERLRHFIATEHPPNVSEDPGLLAARIHERKARRFEEIGGAIVLRPGVARLVAQAKADGLLLAIVTTASEDGVRAVMQSAPETYAAFDLVAAGDVVQHKKPAPDIYRYALEQLGIAPSDAIAFEDSAIGLRAATTAGILTVVTPSIYTNADDFTGAAVVVNTLDRVGPNGPTALAARQSGALDVAYLLELYATCRTPQ